MQNLEFNKTSQKNAGIYGILLDNTHAILDRNLQINGNGFLYSDNAAKTIVKNLKIDDVSIITIKNNSKNFITKPDSRLNYNTSNNSFFNFPNAFPLTFEPNVPDRFPLSSATGGGAYIISDRVWKTMEKVPGVQVSSPILNNGIKYYCNNIKTNGFFTNTFSIALNNNNKDLIINRIFNRVPRDLNGFNLSFTFGKRPTESSPTSAFYDNNGNILNLPAFYNGNVVLYNSISGGILYVHDIKHLRFYENLFKTAVQLSAVNIDNIQITEDCEFFNAIYAKNCNFYVNIGQSVENSSAYFFNVASGTFINCNIYAYGNYYLPDVKKRFMRFQLINSHFSITLKNKENEYNYNISAKLSGFELSKSQISGNGLFNHTHRGPIPSSETIPFYDKTSVGSSYLLPCAYFPPPIPAKKQTPANIFNQRPNNMTTYSNIVYKNILELPVGAIMLSYYHKQCLYGIGTNLSADNRIFTYYH